MSEESLFDLLLAAAPADRAAILDRETADRPEVRDRLNALIAAWDRRAASAATGTFGDEAVTGTFGAPADTATAAPDHETGTVIAGKYTLVERIGEGGMGTVWRAKQTEPVKRFVAVKLIKAGMDSKQVLARFEAERQALALMDHPNIAKVLDGGVTDFLSGGCQPPVDRQTRGAHTPRSGMPYFVMELVKGTPITDYCDAHKLSPKARLELFVQACQAIQHAHQKGIIHRDIKPSNVLVALYDDRPVVKVIDFGVAKATGGTLTEATIDTGFGGIVGTPQYMSPEQATFNNLDIDTRSDVYALGVLLYELLAGSPPFSGDELKKKGLLEMLRVVREVEPPRPSTKLSTADALPSLSANRGTEPKKLTGLLRNELDWIVMKSLEKDRTRRYETANGFAADVNRYLAGEPVLAHPPSAAYRVKKFVRRNRAAVHTATIFAATLIGATSISAWQAKVANDAKFNANMSRLLAEAKATEANEEREKALAAAEKERLATELTAARLKQIETINSTVFDIFAEFDIRKVKRGNDPVEAVLAKKLIAAGKNLDAKAIQDPLVLANLRARLGVTLLNLGETSAAVELLEVAADARKAVLGPDHPETLATLNNLALGYEAVEKTDKALPLLEETYRLTKARHGPDHPNTLTCMNNLASGYLNVGRRDRALPLFEEALTLRMTKLGPNHPDTLTSRNNLAEGYKFAGQLDKAIPLLEETLSLLKARLGPDHPDTLSSMNNLAANYRETGRVREALPLFEETLKLRKAKLGPDHPETLTSTHNLASSYQATGRLDMAITLYEDAIRIGRSKLGPDNRLTLNSLAQLAECYLMLRQPEKAVPLYEEVVGLNKAKFGPDHPETLKFVVSLGVSYWSARRLDKSVPLFEELLRLQREKLGREHPDTLMTIGNLGVNYNDAGRRDEAIPLLEEAYRAAEKIPTLRVVGPPLLDAYVKAGKRDEAARLIDTLIGDARKALPANSPQLAGFLAVQGLTLLEMNGFAAAEPLLRESLAIREKTEPDDWRTFNTQSMLGGALLGQKKYADAEPLLVKGYEGMKAREKTIPPQGAIRLPEALDRLIELYAATNNPDDVKKWRAERANYGREILPLPNVAR